MSIAVESLTSPIIHVLLLKLKQTNEEISKLESELKGLSTYSLSSCTAGFFQLLQHQEDKSERLHYTDINKLVNGGISIDFIKVYCYSFIYIHIFSRSFLCFLKLCVLNMEKVFFLNTGAGNITSHGLRDIG